MLSLSGQLALPGQNIHVSEFGSNIYAYYYDLPFEETLKRHQAKPNCNDFCKEAMRRWWNDKDYIGIIKEKVLTAKMSADDTVDMIMRDMIEKDL